METQIQAAFMRCVWPLGCIVVICLGFTLFGCTPSAHLKAALADEQIRKEVCDLLSPANGDRYFTYSHLDTAHTQDEIREIDRALDAYC